MTKYVVLLLVGIVICFMILPPGLMGQDYLYQRFSVFVLLAFILAGGVSAGETLHTAIKVLIGAVALASIILWHAYYADFNRLNESFGPDVFPKRHAEIATSALVFEYFYRGQHMNLQFPNYHIIWNQGVISTAVVDYRFSLVRRRPGVHLPQFNQLAGFDPRLFRPSDIDTKYLVTYGTIPDYSSRWLRGWKKIRSRAGWTVWENPQYP